MVNEVFVSGKVVEAKEEGNGVMTTVEILRKFSNKEYKTYVNIFLTAGVDVLNTFEWAQKNNKSLYIATRGVLAARKFNKDDKYSDHVYILARTADVKGTQANEVSSRAIIGGEIVHARSFFLPSGTEAVEFRVKNTRTVGRYEFTSRLRVTAFDVEKFGNYTPKVGDTIIAVGRLDSFESKDNKGSYITSVVADEMYLSNVAYPVDVNNRQEESAKQEDKEGKKHDKNDGGVLGDILEEELPF